MKPRHSNPTRPRAGEGQSAVWAHAPYNFVPFAESVVPANPPLSQAEYHAHAKTGWFDCELVTQSPTYVRGMTGDARFYSALTEEIEGRPVPQIPGSSLRGMLRALVEVIGFGYVHWVGREPTFTYRAVAAKRDDPLSEPYKQTIGSFGKNVKAGYLENQGDDWFIRPAVRPESLGLPEKGAYLKVKEERINSNNIAGFIPLNSPNYRPGYFRVCFDIEKRRSQRGDFTAVTKITDPDHAKNLPYQGTLVCSGNMKETNTQGRTRRRNHTLLLEPDRSAVRLRIPKDVVRDYRQGMTDYQCELGVWGGAMGLKVGAPVFYIFNSGSSNQVAWFGHTPNFRLAARQVVDGQERALTPADFVPRDLRSGGEQKDLAESIFGWVNEPGGRQNACAGRVFFRDASFSGAQNGVWYQKEPITLHVLSGPKPTAFQNYLVQDPSLGHSPDNKPALANPTTSLDETQLRGHKFYWIKGANPNLEASVKERKHVSQLTEVDPVKPGVSFKFRIDFENLTPEELGAVCWVLALPGEPGKQYCHRLGMGKPLGMGTVRISSRLYTSDRAARYSSLFEGQRWKLAEDLDDMMDYIREFEDYVLAKIAPSEPRSGDKFVEIDRIRSMLTMLEWRDGSSAWNEQTSYMEIERVIGRETMNEWKDRPVLPTPEGVVALAEGRTPENPPTKPGSLSQPGPQKENVIKRRPQERDRRDERRPDRSKTSDAREPQQENLPSPKPWFSNQEPAARQATRLDVGSELMGVMDFEDDGDVYLKFPSVSQKGVLGRLRGREFQAGQQAKVRVTAISQEGDETILECQPASAKTSPGEMTGVVKSFNVNNSPYGFIIPDSGGKEVFVHQNQLTSGLDVLKPGQKVIFSLIKDKKGRPVAQNVRLSEEEK